MQRGMPTPDLNPVHKLLSKHVVSEDLIVVRLSARAKRLIFKSSVKKGVEILIKPYHLPGRRDIRNL